MPSVSTGWPAAVRPSGRLDTERLILGSAGHRIRSRLIRVPFHSGRYLTRSISTVSSATLTNYSAGLCQRLSERSMAAEQTPSKHGDRYAAPWAAMAPG
jgi:hypothetical protein